MLPSIMQNHLVPGQVDPRMQKGQREKKRHYDREDERYPEPLWLSIAVDQQG
jgi:hypothetical protein